MTGLDAHAMHDPRPDGALAAALERGAYEEVALRLLISVARGIQAAGELAPDAREQLIALLALDDDAWLDRPDR